MIYENFVERKLNAISHQGIENGIDLDGYDLFDHQTVLVKWALRKGRSAIFADTGMGKTRMQLAWAAEVCRLQNVSVLILAPLAVAEQTVEEGADIGVSVTHVRGSDDVRNGINIINYDRLHKINPDDFGAVVLDESSVIKHHDAKSFKNLTDAFSSTPFKLCATATPAPNDWTELGTHAEFLGVCSRAEMLSEFFVHDGGETQKWRLKGHARKQFWKWVSNWGAMIQSPDDLGFDGSMYNLPPLNVEQVTVSSNATAPQGMLFPMEANTLLERRQARRDSMEHRVKHCAAMVNQSKEPWIIWCELNSEGDELKKQIPDAVEIRGSDKAEDKEKSLHDFAHGNTRVLITKPKIAGFGLNWQHCNNVAFVGVTDSFESYYQAVRRCWRFGQKKDVNVYLFVSDLEGAVLNNLQRKERDAKEMFAQLSRETKESVYESVLGQKRQTNEYQPNETIELPRFVA